MSVLAEMSARELLVPLVAAPLIGALLCIFLKRRVSDAVAAIFAVITLVLAIGVIGDVFGNLGSTISVPLGRLTMLGGEMGPAPLVFELSIDALGALMLFMVAVIGFLVVVYSSEYLSPNNVDVANFIADLSASPLFEEVDMGYAKNIVFRSKAAKEFQASCYVVR